MTNVSWGETEVEYNAKNSFPPHGWGNISQKPETFLHKETNLDICRGSWVL